MRIISDEILENNKKFKIKRNRKRFHFEQFNHVKYTFIHIQNKYEIGITIRTFDDLNYGTYDAGLTLRPLESIEPQMISGLLSEISQSNQSFQITGLLEVETIIIEMPSGGTRIDIRTLSEVLKHKKDIVDYPKGANNVCLMNSIWTGRVYCVNDFDVAEALVRSYLRG